MLACYLTPKYCINVFVFFVFLQKKFLMKSNKILMNLSGQRKNL